MDSLTHIALGACVGEAFFGKGFGKKAMLWGALAQSAPDIDFVAGFWMSVPENLLAHRGFTHSLLFAALISPVLAMAAERIHRPRNIRFSKWLIFFATEVFLHLLLDGFNNYGVGWFEPFSHLRVSFNAIYVADPLFSIWPGIAVVMLFLINSFNRRRRFWWRFGLFIPFFYLGICIFNKTRIDREVTGILREQAIPYSRYFTTPTPMNNLLWYVVAGNDEGYHVGFRSLLDSRKKIDFKYFPRNDSLLDPVKGHPDLHYLMRFSQQFYTVEKWGDTLVFNDLRFGQVLGWKYPREKFVFHYFLDRPDGNELVVQRGRFAGWNRSELSYFIRRIKGD